jgi:hypothetical protein
MFVGIRVAIDRGMIRLAFILCFVACGGGTNLDSRVTCEGSSSCGPDEVCFFEPAGIDAGVGGSDFHGCTTVPSSCDLYDCGGTKPCSACIESLCAPTVVESLVGRRLECRGQ